MDVGSAGFHHPAVRAARLLHQKKHRHDRRCFLIEGPLLVSAAIEAKATIEQIFVLKSENGPKGPLLQGPWVHEAAGVPTFEVDRRTMESLAQTKTPQGIAAVVRFLDRELDELPALVPPGGPGYLLVLPNLSDPGNAGTLIRSAEAFGARAVCFGPQSVEPYNDKVVRASMGSLFRVPIICYAQWRHFVTAASSVDLTIVGADASGSDVRAITLPIRTALVVGQERHGLETSLRGDTQMLVAIPQRKGVESLNAGVAGSLLLYELSRAHTGILDHPG